MIYNITLLMTQPNSTGGGAQWQQFLMFPLIFLVLYFFMIRPQQKKAKEANKFKDSIKKGDKIVTIAGIHGKITEIKTNTFIIEISKDVKIEIEKTALSMELTQAINNPDNTSKDIPEQKEIS